MARPARPGRAPREPLRGRPSADTVVGSPRLPPGLQRSGPMRFGRAAYKAGVRLFQGADGVLLADLVPPEAIFRVLAADNQRGHYTEVLTAACTSSGTSAPKPWRPQRQQWTRVSPRLRPAARTHRPPRPVPRARRPRHGAV